VKSGHTPRQTPHTNSKQGKGRRREEEEKEEDEEQQRKQEEEQKGKDEEERRKKQKRRRRERHHYPKLNSLHSLLGHGCQSHPPWSLGQNHQCWTGGQGTGRRQRGQRRGCGLMGRGQG
jgi:hypothetical protein